VGFYANVLGLEECARHTTADGTLRSVWFALGPAVLMIERSGRAEPIPSPDSLELLALSMDASERETWRGRLERAAVTVEDETAHTLYFRDPDGRRLALSSFPL